MFLVLNWQLQLFQELMQWQWRGIFLSTGAFSHSTLKERWSDIPLCALGDKVWSVLWSLRVSRAAQNPLHTRTHCILLWAQRGRKTFASLVWNICGEFNEGDTFLQPLLAGRQGPWAALPGITSAAVVLRRGGCQLLALAGQEQLCRRQLM